MTTECLPRAIPLHRPAIQQLIDGLRDSASAAQVRLRTHLQAWRVRRAERALWQRSAAIERELAHLSPATLRDIGASQGLVGQRRWQDEQDPVRLARILHLQGW